MDCHQGLLKPWRELCAYILRCKFILSGQIVCSNWITCICICVYMYIIYIAKVRLLLLVYSISLNAIQCTRWCTNYSNCFAYHDIVIKWKHFPRYWPFVRGIHRWPVNSPHKGQWRGALMFSLICVWVNSRINNRKAGDLRRYSAHHCNDIIVMIFTIFNTTGQLIQMNEQVKYGNCFDIHLS